MNKQYCYFCDKEVDCFVTYQEDNIRYKDQLIKYDIPIWHCPECGLKLDVPSYVWNDIFDLIISKYKGSK